MEPPFTHRAPPDVTLTGPVRLPPLETQIDWPVVTEKGLDFADVIQACVKPIVMVVVTEPPL